MVKKAISDFPLRIQAVINAGGAHFEQSFKKFKRELRKRKKSCPHCNDEHCGCQVCVDRCEITAHQPHRYIADDDLEYDSLDEYLDDSGDEQVSGDESSDDLMEP